MALAQLPHLESLYIGGNFFEQLSSEDFRGLNLLRNLDLSQSHNLVHLGPRLFANNPVIEVISGELGLLYSFFLFFFLHF